MGFSAPKPSPGKRLVKRSFFETPWRQRRRHRLPFLLRVMLFSWHIDLSTFPAVDGWLSAPLLPQQG